MITPPMKTAASIAFALALWAWPAAAQDQAGPVWPKLSAAERTDVQRMGDEFKQFLGAARTETMFVREASKMVEAAGFRPWPSAPKKADVAPGSKWYAVNRGRSIVAFVIGTEPVVAGTRIVNSHNDSIRIELKPKPFRESFDIAMLDTRTHGAPKNYQWVNRPLALVGRVTRTDGMPVDISIGLQPGDPALVITDLAPHVDADFRERRNRDVIATEELDPILALTRDAALAAIKTRYNLVPDDFLAADLAIVPAEPPVDVGLDGQLAGAYGFDGRINGFASFRAISELKAPQKTAIAYGVNNEELGVSWTTGVESEWFRSLVAEIIASQESSYSDVLLRRALSASQALVADCTTALDPGFPQATPATSSARLGWGVVFKDYGAGRQADAEFFAKVRNIFTDAGVHWQVYVPRPSYSGGTIAQWFANANIDAIDIGTGILSMHSPFEVGAKVDVWELYRGFKAFWGEPARQAGSRSRQ
jgi:aspartyl aminopeptidase